MEVWPVMRNILYILVFLVSGFFIVRKMLVKPPPPPVIVEPPPPPPPVLNAQDEAKILASCRDINGDVRWEAVRLLDSLGSPQALPMLFERLQKDEEVTVRLKVIQLLATKKGHEVAKNLVIALKDQANPPEIRKEVLDALGKVGDFTVGPDVTDCLKDTDETVRLQAIQTINELNNQRDIQVRQLEEDRIRAEEARKAAEGKKKGI